MKLIKIDINHVLIALMTVHALIFFIAPVFDLFYFLSDIPGFAIHALTISFLVVLFFCSTREKKVIKPNKLIYLIPLLNIVWLPVYSISTNIEFHQIYSDIIHKRNNVLLTGVLVDSDRYHYDYDGEGYASPRQDYSHRVLLIRGDIGYFDLITNGNGLRIRLSCGIHNYMSCRRFFEKSDRSVRVYFHKQRADIGYRNIIISIQEDGCDHCGFNYLKEYKKTIFIENIGCIILIVMNFILLFAIRRYINGNRSK